MSRSLHDFLKSGELQAILPLKHNLFKEGNMSIYKLVSIMITISHYWKRLGNLSPWMVKP